MAKTFFRSSAIVCDKPFEQDYRRTMETGRPTRWWVMGHCGWRVNGSGRPLRADLGGVGCMANGAAMASMGGEYAVVASQVDARRRDQRRQRGEDSSGDLTRWVAPSRPMRFIR